MPSLKGSEGLRKETIKERVKKKGAICHSFLLVVWQWTAALNKGFVRRYFLAVAYKFSAFYIYMLKRWRSFD